MKICKLLRILFYVDEMGQAIKGQKKKGAPTARPSNYLVFPKEGIT